MQEQNPCRRSTLNKLEGTQVCRPTIRWLDSVEDFKTMGVRNLGEKSQDWDQWRAILKEAMDCSAYIGIRRKFLQYFVLTYHNSFCSAKKYVCFEGHQFVSLFKKQ
jgi:hypothetical protein